MKHHFSFGAALLSAGAASFSLTACSDKAPQPKNVLFIMVDDMRPSLGCYGDPYAKTPALDGLASDASVYTRAYCQQALSGPSRASILTGLRPEENGVTELNTWIRKKNRNVVTLPQAFKAAGYHTASVGKTFHGNKNTLDTLSWSQKPELYHYTKSDEYMFAQNKTGQKSVSYEFSSEPEDWYLDMKIRNRAVQVLDSLACSGEQFFLAVGFLKPHLPFCAPQRFMDMYEDVDFGAIDTSRIHGAPSLAYHNSNELRGYIDVGDSTIDDAQLKKAYYACTSFADENIGAMIQELKRLGLYDNTVIVVLGDHGYHTGEQGIWCKSTNYEAACHSPLIIKDAYQKKASSVSVPVEFIDIFPTLAQMCGVDAPVELSGKNLNDLDSKKEYYAFSQFPRPYAALHRAKARTHMGYTVRDSRWRYVEWYDNDGNLAETELYDLSQTELETENLSGSPACSLDEVRLKSALAKLPKNVNFTAK